MATSRQLEIEWYTYIKPGDGRNALFNFYTIDDLQNRLLISQVDDRNFHKFAVFRDYIHFWNYQKTIAPEKRTFYEVIIGKYPQKPHFDIDINLESAPPSLPDGEIVKSIVIDKIIECFAKLGISLEISKDIMLFTSHGKQKRSYHIVVNNYYHDDYVQAKLFYNMLMDAIPRETGITDTILDKGVYKSIQQFRLLGSQKLGSNRPKVLAREWQHKDSKIFWSDPFISGSIGADDLLIFKSSLVTYTRECSKIPTLEPKKIISCVKDKYEDEGTLTPEEESQCMKLLGKHVLANNPQLKNSRARLPYEPGETRGKLMLLKRTASSMCTICNRIHDHENPFIFVTGEEYSVYFNCRRSDHSKFLGSLYQRKPVYGDGQLKLLSSCTNASPPQSSNGGLSIDEIRRKYGNVPIITPLQQYTSSSVELPNPPNSPILPTPIILPTSTNSPTPTILPNSITLPTSNTQRVLIDFTSPIDINIMSNPNIPLTINLPQTSIDNPPLSKAHNILSVDESISSNPILSLTRMSSEGGNIVITSTKKPKRQFDNESAVKTIMPGIRQGIKQRGIHN